MRGFSKHLGICFGVCVWGGGGGVRWGCNKLDKFINTGALMFYSIFHMELKLKHIGIPFFGL